jgi:hypothetical protein
MKQAADFIVGLECNRIEIAMVVDCSRIGMQWDWNAVATDCSRAGMQCCWN